jgi:RND family efflux transporter MFP subunit
VQTAVATQTAALPVVTLSRVDRLRVYVYLDQKNANLVRPGDSALIADPARPEVKVSASVTRMSGELDPKTRTLLTEVEVDNRGGKIIAGSFVEVTLKLRTGANVAVPAEALLMRGEKPHVAVIDGANKARIRPVVIAGTDGTTVKLHSGLSSGEKVILSPGAGIQEGELVRPAAGAK